MPRWRPENLSRSSDILSLDGGQILVPRTHVGQVRSRLWVVGQRVDVWQGSPRRGDAVRASHAGLVVLGAASVSPLRGRYPVSPNESAADLTSFTTRGTSLRRDRLVPQIRGVDWLQLWPTAPGLTTCGAAQYAGASARRPS